MKTKNQTGHDLLELAVATAANEDGFSPNTRDADAKRKPAWSPYEVWLTRVKHPHHQPTTENPARR
jgi:hypothetical protein